MKSALSNLQNAALQTRLANAMKVLGKSVPPPPVVNPFNVPR